MSFLWTEIVTRPMTNSLVFIDALIGGNFGLAIILFTILTRVVLYPLTLRQLRSTRAMQELQPRIKALQEKYKNDRQRLQKEQLKMFREAGVNPLGCLGPLILQMPIFIGLFQVIRTVVADTPEGLVTLSQRLYSWLPLTDAIVPLNTSFLGMDLGSQVIDNPGIYMVLFPVLVGGSMWVVQKMSQTPSMDPAQQSTQQMMTVMFPLMFGFFTLNFPAGLALYWIVSNLVSIALQYRAGGWGGLAKTPAPVPAPAATSQVSSVQASVASGQSGSGVGGFLKKILLGNPPVPEAPPQPDEAPAQPGEAPAAESPTSEQGESDGRSRSDRQDSRRSYRKSSESTRRRAGRRGRRRR